MSKIPVSKTDFTEAEVEAASRVIRSGWVAQGPAVARFETELAAYAGGTSKVLCVSSCTSGLTLALRAKGIGAGDEVIVPSYSYIATANAVVHAGATPVFADIDEGASDVNMSLASARAAIGKRTRAILLVHQGGVPADIDAFGALAAEKGLSLIEDAACAIGSVYRGATIGRHSELVVFSFHPRKVVATGEGGAIFVNGGDKTVARFLEMSRSHGMSEGMFERHQSASIEPETYPIIGVNARMTDVQAAIGSVQLARLSSMLAARRKLAEHYRARLGEREGLALTADPAFGRTNFQTLLLTVDPVAGDARTLMTALAGKGISTRRGIMSAHEEPCYRDRKETRRVALDVTERAVRRRLVLPLYSTMTMKECDLVCDTVLEILQNQQGD